MFRAIFDRISLRALSTGRRTGIGAEVCLRDDIVGILEPTILFNILAGPLIGSS
jgi:hypothetical protein